MLLRQLILATIIFVSTAPAGVFIKQTTTEIGSGAVQETEVSVEGTRIHTKHPGQVFIYDGPKETFYLCDLNDGTYRKFTRAQLEQMLGQASQMSAMIEEKLQGLDPQQRAMVEKMLKGKMAGMPNAEVQQTVYRRTGTEQIGDWSATKYEGTRGSEKVEDVWTVSPSALGLRESDFQAFYSLAGMFEQFSNKMNVNLYRIGRATAPEGEYAGVPVQRIVYRNGQPYQKHNVDEVRRQDFGDDLFQVPSDLRFVETPMGMGGR